jgi:hypothetical protein
MKLLILALAASLPAATPVKDTPGIPIRPGQMITLQVNGDDVRIIAIGAAPPISPYEAETARRMGAIELPADAGPQPAISFPRGSVVNEPPPAVPGQVRMTFRRVPGPRGEEHSLLFVLNGYDLSFRYRATMHTERGTQPTDVCEVRPHISVNEHWPYVIDQLDISNVRLEPRSEGDVICE